MENVIGTTGYYVNVKESSWDVTGREKVKMKDSEHSIKLDSLVDENGDKTLIDVVGYAVLEVHNDRSKLGSPDYLVLMIKDKDGTFYSTGSECCRRNFDEVWSDMEGEWESEPYLTMYFKKVPASVKEKFALICGLA